MTRPLTNIVKIITQVSRANDGPRFFWHDGLLTLLPLALPDQSGSPFIVLSDFPCDLFLHARVVDNRLEILSVLNMTSSQPGIKHEASIQ